jgi:hypothetical protein
MRASINSGYVRIVVVSATVELFAFGVVLTTRTVHPVIAFGSFIR